MLQRYLLKLRFIFNPVIPTEICKRVEFESLRTLWTTTMRKYIPNDLRTQCQYLSSSACCWVRDASEPMGIQHKAGDVT